MEYPTLSLLISIALAFSIFTVYLHKQRCLLLKFCLNSSDGVNKVQFLSSDEETLPKDA